MRRSTPSPASYRNALALACAGVLGLACSSNAALTAYYTLDDLTSGIQNRGTDGATSDLSAADANSTPTMVEGLIGGALLFDGNDLLRNLDAGNAGDDLTAYPFTLSIWLRNLTVDAARDAAFGVSNRAVGGTYYVVGGGTNVNTGGRIEAELVRRNSQFTPLDASGTDISGSGWTNIVAVFGTTNAELFVNGKSAATATINQTFSSTVNTISIGGFLRTSPTLVLTDPLNGQADDAGLFDTALVASDVALINGLGLTGGIGLDQLDEAQALNAMVTGSVGQIGGATWKKVSGLIGAIGDFGGTVSGGNAFIVTDAAGNGIQVIPEPATGTLLAFGVVAQFSRRKRRP